MHKATPKLRTLTWKSLYSPTYRFNSGANFNTEATSIFSSTFESEELIGTLATRIQRYFLKNYIDHTVHCSADKLKELAVFISEKHSKQICAEVKKVVQKQQKDGRYDYASNEQLLIEKLNNEAFCLTEEDIEELEYWYARRYTRLAAAQLENLRKAGKTKEYDYFRGLWQSEADATPAA